MVPDYSATNLEKVFAGVWRRARSTLEQGQITPELISQWVNEKGLQVTSSTACYAGLFASTPGVVLDACNKKAFFPTAFKDETNWLLRREAKEIEASLWDKVEWFVPLWIPMGQTAKLLADIRLQPRPRALESFDYHTSTMYTIPFEAICIAQIMPQSRSLREFIPLVREAFLGVYSGYKASSIAALMPIIEGSLTRIAGAIPDRATAAAKIDHAVDRAIQTAADLHFQQMWTPPEYKTLDYLFAQDERVFAFETFRRWLKNYFFCSTDSYKGLTSLNRHMFAHGTISSWQKPNNFTRLLVALSTMAAIESWYDSSHSVSFNLPEMNEDARLLWQQALFQAQAQMQLKLIEQDRYQKLGRLVPEMPTDDGVLLRKAMLSEECMQDLVRPLRKAGWRIEVTEPDERALYMLVKAESGEEQINIAFLYSCGTENGLYRKLSETCSVILYRGAPYRQEAFAYGISAHVGPVLGWQPPSASKRQWRW